MKRNFYRIRRSEKRTLSLMLKTFGGNSGLEIRHLQVKTGMAGGDKDELIVRRGNTTGHVTSDAERYLAGTRDNRPAAGDNELGGNFWWGCRIAIFSGDKDRIISLSMGNMS